MSSTSHIRLIQRFVNRATVLMLVLSLAGCVGLRPRADPTRYYVLHAARPAAVEARPVDLVVRRVELPGYLDSSRVVIRVDAHEIKYRHAHRWSGHLDEMIAQAVADAIEAARPGQRASASPAAAADETLDLRLLRFEGATDGAVEVAFEWQVIRGGASNDSLSGRVSRSGQWDGTDIGQLVEVLADLLREAASEVAHSIEGQQPQG